MYEQPHIIAQRQLSSEKSAPTDEKKRPIVYLDEIWLIAHGVTTLLKSWIDYDGIGGLRVPSGKGDRVIVLNDGSEHG